MKRVPIGKKKYNKIKNRENILKRNQVKNEKAYVAIHDENKDGYIVLKQESLYKPLLVVFGIQVFVMLVLFPNIFDSLWPDAMLFIRNIISWMALSAAGTLLPIPGMSPSDYRYIRLIVDLNNSDMYILLIGLLIICSDTLFAFFGYKFTKTLRKLFASKASESDVKKTNERFQKYGNVAMFLGSATPLPFTLMVYTAGAIKLPKKGFLIAVFFGRMFKYTILAVPIRLFNFDVINYGRILLEKFLEGNLVLEHFIIVGIVVLLITWLAISIFRTIRNTKKNKTIN
jgi:membrane protein YqaA with SNARE-associated domain